MIFEKSTDLRNSTPRFFSSFDKKTRTRLITTAVAAADCVVNVLILVAFAAIGTISWFVPPAILFIAAAINGIFFIAIGSGASKKFNDPSLTWAQVLAGCGANLLALVMAPQIAYMFVLNLFVSLSFGSLYFNRRQFLLTWMLLSLALGGTLMLVAAEVGIAHATPAERFLFWFVATLTLGRFLVINAEISRLRARLHERNKELAGATARLADLASHDELTNLANRREFLRLLQSELQRGERSGAPFWVAIVDADHFKQVNDRFGHHVGDLVLQELARLLDSTRRATDTLARYGGEEFTLLLIDPKPDAVVSTLERLRKIVEQHDWECMAAGLRMSISVGVAEWHRGEAANHLLSRADTALYEAKNTGRNRICVAQ